MAETATIGGGCFWCLEALFKRVQGITEVVSGYAGGDYPNPRYEDLHTKDTGHAEVVKLTYDPDMIEYREILEIFFSIHDPTTPNRQGNDIGPEYRSIILYNDETQKTIAEEVIRTFAANHWNDPIVTEIKQLDAFYPAEDYHQNYFDLNPSQAYCQVIINPKLMKFKQDFANRLKD